METDVTHTIVQPEHPNSNKSEHIAQATTHLTNELNEMTSSDDSDLDDSDLKEVMPKAVQSNEEGLSFFHRYFQSHSNSLPSKLMGVTVRRLSQCREEDEDDERKDQSVGVDNFVLTLFNF